MGMMCTPWRTDKDEIMDTGIFITFEGGDGSGKTTHMRFLAESLRARGTEVVCLREPGGTIIGERLRNVVLDPGNDAMTSECELLIYEAARAQIVGQVVRPALERGAVVLCDRYTDSTIAYQSFGRGLDRGFIERANDFACQGVYPRRTILMQTGGSAEEGLVRASHRAGADRLELAGVAFHERVNAGYLQLAREFPERIRIVVSDKEKSETARRVFAELSDLFPWMGDQTVCTPAFFARANVKPYEMGM